LKRKGPCHSERSEESLMRFFADARMKTRDVSLCST
jgi:hypothetical protein